MQEANILIQLNTQKRKQDKYGRNKIKLFLLSQFIQYTDTFNIAYYKRVEEKKATKYHTTATNKIKNEIERKE